MREKLLSIAKTAIALTVIALAVTLITAVVDQAYDLRLVLAAAGGAFGYQPLLNLLNKIKQLN